LYRAGFSPSMVSTNGTPEDTPLSEQHSFLDLAKEFEWNKMKRSIQANPGLVNVQPAGRDGTVRWSALHQAAFGGCGDAVRFLLDHGAAVDAKTHDGRTPADVARSHQAKAMLAKAAGSAAAAPTPALLPGARGSHARAARSTGGRAARRPRAMKKTKAAGVRKAKVARGKRGKALVYRGRFERTPGKLRKEDLARSKSGKIVSKRMQACGQRAYGNIRAWVDAMMGARAQLGLSGFVPIRRGSPLYLATKARLGA